MKGFYNPGVNLSAVARFMSKNDAIIQAAFNMAKTATSIIDSIPSYDYARGLFSAIGLIIETHQKFAKQILEEIKEEKEICKDPKFKEFPFLLAGYLTIPEMRRLKEEWLSDNKEYVITKVKKTLKMPAIHDEILDNIKENNPLYKRKKLLKEALWAHQQGKYILSIPLLFPIIEGTLVDKYGWLYEEKKCDKCKRKFGRTAKPVLESIKSKLKKTKNKSIFIDHYFAQIEHLLESFSSNRNPILHGSKIDYENETLSAALILSATSLDFKDILIEETKV